MTNGFDKFKKGSAEAAMKESGKKIMEEARRKKEKKSQESHKIGKWEITLKSNGEYADVDIENFITKLMGFESVCNTDFPMMKVQIDPVIESK